MKTLLHKTCCSHILLHNGLNKPKLSSWHKSEDIWKAATSICNWEIHTYTHCKCQYTFN